MSATTEPVRVVRGRLALASARDGGRRRVDLATLAAELAAPHTRPIEEEALRAACAGALGAGGLGSLDALGAHAGAGAACTRALLRTWQARERLDQIPEGARSARLTEIAALSERVREQLGPSAGTRREVLRAATRAVERGETALPEQVVFTGRASAGREGASLACALMERTAVRWEGPQALMPTWARSPQVETRTWGPTEHRSVMRVSAAHPLHEALAALGWVRALLAGGVEPGDVALALVAPGDHEAHVGAYARSAGLALRPTRGTPALETGQGQACAALARGETVAHDEATRALWEATCARARTEGMSPARALAAQRIEAPEDARAHIAVGPLGDVADAGRSHVLVLGLSASRWPARGRDEETVLRAADARALGLDTGARASARTLDALGAQTGTTLVLSRPRREADGKTAARAVLPEWAGHDERALARGGDAGEPWPSIEREEAGEGFAPPAHAGAAAAAYEAGGRAELGPHDGRVRAAHPVIAHIVARRWTPSALARLLTDPLGFVWRYGLALAGDDPASGDEPLGLDPRGRGALVHALAAAASRALEGPPGDPARAEEALERAAGALEGPEWGEAGEALGEALWWATIARAREEVAWALGSGPVGTGAARAQPEVAFEGLALAQSAITLEGAIDRVDRDGEGRAVAVVDYRSGRARARGAALEGGRAIQHVLNAAGARAGAGDPWPESWQVHLRGESATRLEDPEGALALIDAAAAGALAALEAGDAVPGPGTGAPYDPLRFLLPARAARGGLERKEEAARALGGAALATLWETR